MTKVKNKQHNICTYILQAAHNSSHLEHEFNSFSLQKTNVEQSVT